MPKQVCDDTLTASADFYLDDTGNEITRKELLEQVRDGWYAFMLYVGDGYVPLRVAVLTRSARGFHQPDESEAVSIFEEWARNTGRGEEIGEDEDYFAALERGEEPDREYSLQIEIIPQNVEDPQE